VKTKPVLLTRPLKEIPRRIIYKTSNKYPIYASVNGPKVYAHVYNMVDLETREFVATMKAGAVTYNKRKPKIYPIKTPYKSYYVAYLESAESGLGYGTEMINLAKLESKKQGCEGRVHLTASRVYTPRRPPHLFYRKLGFESVCSYINEIMDFCLSIGRQLPVEYADNIEMYLPVTIKHTVKSKSKLKSFLNFFKEKFTKN
jgi:GNAT superfamily N-acetyltransferase